MVGTSKILTVSYGTFSCTLEGFDDPFSTMKSIAEYFRDLAADDRYFGAEPPTPDAEMLQRIAEKEINRRVEARVNDTGLVLRQLEDQAAAAAAPAPAPVSARVAPAAAAPAAPAPAEADRPVGPAQRVEVIAPAAPVAAGDSIAAKMARIRAAVARSSAPETAYSEDQHAEEMFVSRPIAAAFADLEDRAEVQPVDDEAPDEALARQAAPEDEAEAAPADEVELATDQAPKGLEPLLASIREEIRGTVPAPEPEEIEALIAEAEAPIDEMAEPVETPDLEPQTAGAAGPAAEEFFAGTGARDDYMEEGETPDATALANVMTLISAAETRAEPEAAEEPQPARAPKMRKADFDRALLDDEAAELDDEAVAPALETVPAAEMADAPAEEIVAVELTVEIGEQAEDDDLSAGPGEASAADDDRDDEGEDDFDWDESPVESALTEDEEPDESVEEKLRASLGETSLPADDEADLLKELAEVELEARESRRAARRAKALPVAPGASDEESVSRLLAQTNSKFEETDTSRRRSTMAHLKAAVAATRAEQDARDGKPVVPEEADINLYRDDLNRVVRPRRQTEARTQTEWRMAPLMLVSEQRIDVPSNRTQKAAVQPRRVAAAQLSLIDNDDLDAAEDAGAGVPNFFADDTGFAEFVTSVGAEKLPDLLEAAVAYAVQLEGRPHVTRPYVMGLAMNAGTDTFSREDGLRAFGALLRQNRISKLKRGQFVVGKASRFATPLGGAVRAG
jgi:hypothetical protein